MVTLWRKEVAGTETSSNQVTGQVTGNEGVNEGVNGTLNGTLNSKQKDVLAFITTTPGVQAQEIILSKDLWNCVRTMTDWHEDH